MNRVLAGVLIAAILGNAYLAWELNARFPPTTTELDLDLTEVRGKRASLNTADAKLAQNELDRIYAQTEAMLDQKRRSIIRFINVDYKVDGHAVLRASVDTLSEIDKDIQKERVNVDAAKSDASKYSGGLIQALSQARQATAELSVAALEHQRLTEKYGLSAPITPERNKDANRSTSEAIQSEIAEKKLAISTAESEAARYSGGLVLAMLLSRIETEKLSLAMLEHKALVLKYDIGLPSLEVNQPTRQPQTKPPGKVVNDKEALQ